MDIRQLETFLTVAKLLNFRAASEALNYSQSTVSDHIRNLENELNVKLFERLGRKVFLNEHGRKLIDPAQKLIKDAQEIHRLFEENEITGTLNIGAAETLCATWLPPLLKEYKELYPKVQISLNMADCFEFPDMLQKNIIDVAFGMNDESSNAQICQIDLFSINTVFVTSPSNSLAQNKSISLHDLEDESLILIELQGGYSYELMKILKKNNINAKSITEFNSIEAIKQCVKNNLGTTLLPAITVNKEIKSGELVVLPAHIPSITVSAKMIYHKEKYISQPLAALKELVLERKHDIYNEIIK